MLKPRQQIAVFQSICESFADANSGTATLLNADSDFEKGVQDQVLACLYLLARDLEDIQKLPPHSIPIHPGQNAEAAFFRFLAEASVITSDPENIPPAPAPGPKMDWDKFWDKLEERGPQPDEPMPFNDFAQYEKGLKAGSQRFLEVVFPVMIEVYQEKIAAHGSQGRRGPALN